MNRPLRYPTNDGSVIAAHRATHVWHTFDGETRCMDCDCRPTGAYATWPCGADVPRTGPLDGDEEQAAYDRYVSEKEYYQERG